MSGTVTELVAVPRATSTFKEVSLCESHDEEEDTVAHILCRSPPRSSGTDQLRSPAGAFLAIAPAPVGTASLSLCKAFPGTVVTTGRPACYRGRGCELAQERRSHGAWRPEARCSAETQKGGGIRRPPGRGQGHTLDLWPGVPASPVHRAVKPGSHTGKPPLGNVRSGLRGLHMCHPGTLGG